LVEGGEGELLFSLPAPSALSLSLVSRNKMGDDGAGFVWNTSLLKRGEQIDYGKNFIFLKRFWVDPFPRAPI
jgi:hypothetical protein